MLCGDAVDGSACIGATLAISPSVSTVNAARKRCAPRTEITNTIDRAWLLVTDTRRTCPTPTSPLLRAAALVLPSTTGFT
jgi:hypothetical protein